MGEYDLDGDIASKTEGRIVGNSTWRKGIWVAVLGVSQALRPLRLKGVPSARPLVGASLNFVVIGAVDIAIVRRRGARGRSST